MRQVRLAPPHGQSKRWPGLTVVLTVIVIGYFLLSRFGGARSKSAQVAVRPGVPVSADEVKRGDLNRFLTAIGTVTAFNTVTVKTRVDG